MLLKRPKKKKCEQHSLGYWVTGNPTKNFRVPEI